MSISLAIASWTLGSIILGLLLGQVFRRSAKRRRSGERFTVPRQAISWKPTRPSAQAAKAQNDARPKTGCAAEPRWQPPCDGTTPEGSAPKEAL